MEELRTKVEPAAAITNNPGETMQEIARFIGRIGLRRILYGCTADSAPASLRMGKAASEIAIN